MNGINKTFFIAILFCLISCTELLGPTYAEEPAVKNFVLRHSYSQGYNVEMIDWQWSGTQGETFTGYYVVYSVNSTEYIIIDLVEFDNGKYEMKFINRARSLSSLYEDYGW